MQEKKNTRKMHGEEKDIVKSAAIRIALSYIGIILQSAQFTLRLANSDRIGTTAQAASERLASSPEADSRGAVSTRTEVVEFILDLVGYTQDQPLYQQRLLEPSFGSGSFLLPIITRLMHSWKARRSHITALEDLSDALRATELHRQTYNTTHAAVIHLLKQEGLTTDVATTLAMRWLMQGDFLLIPLEGEFDFVVGNPPFVRQDLIPASLLAEYRTRYTTLYDRADLYIPFIERSLSLLAQGRNLGFICADRWMKNKYGGPLRQLVAEQFHLKIYVDMMDIPAFHSNVIAYPAVTVISREVTGLTRIARCPAIDSTALTRLADLLRNPTLPQKKDAVHELAHVTNGAEPWLLESSAQTLLIRRIEQHFPSLEEAGCKVGIGVATGADKVFIGNYDQLDIEPDRKLPLAMTKDIRSGEVNWCGQAVINPFTDTGGLVDLQEYPRLRRYLEAHRAVIEARHCARKSPANWYRTIDRITPSLAATPKLLIPDIKGDSHIVFDSGTLYPHHNLYYITTNEWDLRALQAVLLSTVTRFLVSTYSTKMQGGFLRFQAQYLRRIRIPYWDQVPIPLRDTLIDAAIRRDISACNAATFELYGIDAEEQLIIGGTGI